MQLASILSFTLEGSSSSPIGSQYKLSICYFRSDFTVSDGVHIHILCVVNVVFLDGGLFEGGPLRRGELKKLL